MYQPRYLSSLNAPIFRFFCRKRDLLFLFVSFAFLLMGHVTYAQQPTPTVSLSVIQHATCGGADGIIALTISGWPPNSAYITNWNDGHMSFETNLTTTRTGLSAGTYSVSVDLSPFSPPSLIITSNTVTINEPAALTLSASSVTHASSCGSNDGALTVSVSGGNAPYSYEWDNGMINMLNSPPYVISRSNLSVGTYQVTVTDASNCTHQSLTVSINGLGATGGVTPISCYGANDGSIDVTVSGGTPTYTWSRDPPAGFTDPGNVEDLLQLEPGIYTVTVTDAGCSAILMFTLTEPEALTVSAGPVTHVSCSGGNDGALTASVSGGTPPYTYLWDTGDNTPGLVGLTVGPYQVTVTDANGCEEDFSYTIGLNSPLTVSVDLLNHVSCFGGNGGFVNVTVSGGTPPYTYLWNTGHNTSVAVGPAGTYRVTVTDSGGCTESLTVSITQPDAPLTVAVGVTNTICQGASNGSINVTVSGGTPPYTYMWQNGTVANLTGLPAGTYILVVEDSQPCPPVTLPPITINSVPPITLTHTASHSNVNCSGTGILSVAASGGDPNSPYLYQWDDPNNSTTAQIQDLAPGTYTVTVSQAGSSCEAIESYTITAPPNAFTAGIAPSSTVPIACNGGTATATVTTSGGTPPYSFLWPDPNITTPTNSSLSAGTYTVTVDDADPTCPPVLVDFTITEPDDLVVTHGVTNVSCSGGSDGSISLTASGGAPGYTYVWNNGLSAGTSHNNLSAGNYRVTVTDANGCTQSLSVNITEPFGFMIIYLTTDITCHGANDGSINVSVFAGGTPPYTYLWNTGAVTPSLSGLAAGTYWVTVTGNNGCEAYRSYTITEPDALVVTGGTTDITCHGAGDGSIDVTVSGGTPNYTYTWSRDPQAGFSDPGTEDLSGLQPGVYTLSVTDDNDCPGNTLMFTITEPDDLTVSAGSVTHVSCFGDSDGALTVSISGGTPGYTYVWDNGLSAGASHNNLSAGNYRVTVTDVNGCTDSLSINITQPSAIVATGGTTDITCHGAGDGSIDVTISGGAPGNYVFSWNNGPNLILPAPTVISFDSLSAGIYEASVTDDNGCQEFFSYTIAEPEALVVTGGTTDITCHGASDGSIDVSVSGGNPNYTYAWSRDPQAGFTDPGTEDLSGLQPGVYTLSVTDDNDCPGSTLMFTITEPDDLTVSAGSVTHVSCFGGSDGALTVSVSGGTPGYTYVWNNGLSAGTSHSNLTAGTYRVTVTDDNGCTDSLSINITQPGAALAATGGSTNITCHGAGDGSIDVTVSGGTPNYTYTWSRDPQAGFTDPGTEDLSQLEPGIYTLNVTDDNDCSATLMFTLAGPEALTVSAGSVTDISCFGGSDGALTVSASGGTPGYTYVWDNGLSAGTSHSNLNAGTYRVTVMDANGCTDSLSVNITQPGAALAATGGSTNISCHGAGDGSIDVTVSGGTPNYIYTWSRDPQAGFTDPGTEDLSGLQPGIYTLNVTDDNDCSATLMFTLAGPEALTVSTGSVTDISCFGGSDGALAVSVSGGAPGYTYVWDNGLSAGTSHSNLSAGTYRITVTDDNGCTDSLTVNITQPSAALAATGGSTNISCHGANDGSIDVSVSGGTPNYIYTWSRDPQAGFTDPGTEDLSQLDPGIYTLNVTDDNGCSATLMFTLAGPEALTVSTGSVTDVSCFGGSDGALAVSASGGTPGYTYVWDNGLSAGTSHSNLNAGTYRVTVTDANGCTDSLSINITQPSAALAATGGSTNITCHGAGDGSIDVTVSGGTPNYIYTWSRNPQAGFTDPGTEDLSQLDPGIYTLNITDDNDCSATLMFILTEPEALAVSTGSVTDISCFGGSDGALAVSVSGGTPGYTFVWDNGLSAGTSHSNLNAGTYRVTVTDANGCTDSLTVNIPQAGAALAATGGSTNITCHGAGDGSIDVTVSGGTPTYTYAWSRDPQAGFTDPGTEDLSQLEPGIYTLNVTDDNDCSATLMFTLAGPEALTVSAGSVTDISCFGGSDGALTVSVSGGTPGYTYMWDNGLSAGTSHSNLSAGTYRVTVMDANGCTDSLTVNITEPGAALAATGGSTNISCHGAGDGSIDVTVSGGTPNYTYAWSRDPQAGFTDPGTEDLSQLDPGIYTLNVTDDNGCSATLMFTLAGPEALTVSAGSVTDISCFGGSDGALTVSVSGGSPGYTYLWNNGLSAGTSHSNLNAGTYRVTVTDANGCADSLTVNITEPGAALAATGGSTNISCHGAGDGSIDVTVSGGTPNYTYAWSRDPQAGFTDPGTEDLSQLDPGIYTLNVTDDNGCSATLMFTLAGPEALTVSAGSVTDISCFGGSDGALTVSVSGGSPGYTYLWNNGLSAGTSHSNLNAGTYRVTVTDANGCTDSLTVNIIQPSALVATGGAINTTTCGASDGSIALTISGGTPGYTYAWNNGLSAGTSHSNLSAGTYQVSVTDASGCREVFSYTVTGSAALIVSTTITDTDCFGANTGAIDVTVSGGTPPYSFIWSHGAITPNVQNLLAGSYQLTVTDAGGCTQPLSVNITQPGALVATGGATNTTTCGASDGSITLTISGGTPGYTYAWDNGLSAGTSHSNLSAGTYQVSVTDASGCGEVFSYTVTGSAALIVSTTITDTDCFGANTGAIDVTVSGGTPPYSFIWSHGAITPNVQNLLAGSYQLTVTDAGGCIQSLSVNITEPSALVATGGSSNITTCGASDGSIALTISGGTPGYTYVWDNGLSAGTSHSNLGAGTYQVSVTDASGCREVFSYTVTGSAALIVSTTITDTDCFGANTGAIDVTVSGGTPPYSFIWSHGAMTQNVQNLLAGSYQLTVTDAGGCTQSLAVNITQPGAALAATGGATNITTCGASDGSIALTISGGTPGYTYVWDNGLSAGTSHSNLSAGTYQVSVTDASGCGEVFSYTVTGSAALIVSTTITDTDCFGANTGAIDVTVGGGTPPYSFIWSHGAMTPNVQNLLAGSYQLTVTDAGGCTVNINNTVAQNTAISAIIVQSNVDCFGGSNGSVSLNVSGGIPPYSYLWNTGAITSTLSNLTAGAYQITVTDASGCVADNQVVITEPAELVVTADTVGPDALMANVSGGSPPYNYLWGTTPPQTTQTATGLSPDTYTVTVTDVNGCSATAIGEVISIEELSFVRHISLYPNPTEEEVFVDYNFTSEVDLEVTVVNNLGQVVLTISEPNAVSGQLRLDVTDWANGTYSVLFSNGSHSSSRQLVIQK